MKLVQTDPEQLRCWRHERWRRTGFQPRILLSAYWGPSTVEHCRWSGSRSMNTAVKHQKLSSDDEPVECTDTIHKLTAPSDICLHGLTLNAPKHSECYPAHRIKESPKRTLSSKGADVMGHLFQVGQCQGRVSGGERCLVVICHFLDQSTEILTFLFTYLFRTKMPISL